MRSIRTKEVLDRQDIDALLVGALYGELSSTDQERLNTHLEAHPADRNTLDDLKSAQQVIRTKVASSRIFELQLDPPQAISAQLLQEAARRAPKMKTVDAAGKEGWFARFVHTFVAHPAMAAAATLVLVIGVAGSIYLRTGIAEPTVGQLAAPSVPNNEPNRQGDLSKAKSASAPTGAAADGVPVALAEDKPREEAQTEGREGAVGGALSAVRGAPAATAPATTPSPNREPSRHVAKAAFVESEQADLQPKDLDESKFAKNDKQASDRRADPVAAAPAADDAATTLAPRANGPGGAPAHSGTSATIAASPPPPPAPVTKPAPDSNYAWAKDQHARVASLVKAGKCQEAAPLAVAIKSRDPDYYSSFVATDRALKPCMQYVTEAADREAEKKPAKARVTTETR
ncbi:hypothetical protein BH11MYX1_BH11MYX1_18490 [soil metagenome]